MESLPPLCKFYQKHYCPYFTLLILYSLWFFFSNLELHLPLADYLNILIIDTIVTIDIQSIWIRFHCFCMIIAQRTTRHQPPQQHGTEIPQDSKSIHRPQYYHIENQKCLAHVAVEFFFHKFKLPNVSSFWQRSDVTYEM